jgi:hypothetical protein
MPPVPAARPPAAWIFIAACVLAALALGAAESGREFATLELSSGAGPRLLAATATGLRADGGLQLTLSEGPVEVRLLLPADAAPGQALAAPVIVVDAGARHLGTARFEVDESGDFLAGRLQAALGPVTLAGGLRVRLARAPPGLYSAHP